MEKTHSYHTAKANFPIIHFLFSSSLLEKKIIDFKRILCRLLEYPFAKFRKPVACCESKMIVKQKTDFYHLRGVEE
jgi:hypothetical protein